jgi:N-acetylneuraminic acid mutarotase
MFRRYLAWSILLTLGLLACDDGGGAAPAPTPDGAVAECTEGARRCAADGQVQACGNGAWSSLGACPADQACEDGACVSSCTPLCDARACGDDGCGGQCGTCEVTARCTPAGTCEELPRCGDGVCDEIENCAICPGDCGQCCGDGACAPDEGCANCPSDCSCGDGQNCEPQANQCVCAPQCDGRICGPDGCGGSCGGCGDDEFCTEAGRCDDVPAQCGNNVCEDDESCLNCPADCGQCCGDGACSAVHGEDCATCAADCGCPDGEACNGVSHACEVQCAPNCDGRDCGDDGCGGTCGNGCGADQLCNDGGLCVERPAQCGDNSCDAGEDCATCPADCGQCCGNGACSAGENCATCPADCECADGERCDFERRACEAACQPMCDGRACGADGCGGTCGDGCGQGEVCNGAGACVDEPAQCGDNTCDMGEDCATCPADCGQCCGNEICGADENCALCPADCGCEAGSACDPDERQCVVICVPECDGLQCGPDGCGGTCGRCDDGTNCEGGQCVPVCSAECDGRSCGGDGCGGLCGLCGDGQVCTAGGQCLGGEGCNCVAGEVCLNDVCRPEGELCSNDNPLGLCANGQDCVAGACRDNGSACSAQNPTGVCAAGQICREGECEAFDGPGLCNDENPCTADVFDHARNRCVYQAIDAACTDGNECTINACVEGACIANIIQGCLAPPTVEAIPSPTNVGAQVLRGTKPEGSAIEINGEVAVPESPDAAWEVPVNLVLGLNVYRVRSTDAGEASGEIEVRVVYDLDPPQLATSPAGGVFLDGVTITVAANEPSWVYFTTDGGTPDTWSDRFYSARTFRVFDTTHFRFRARDLAGNWQADITEAHYEITGEGNGWASRAELAEPRTHVSAATDGSSRIWVAAGSDGQAPQAGAWRYNVRTEEWSDLPSLVLARAQASLVRHGNAIYLFGGENDGIPLNMVTRLPDGDAAWENRRAMPSTRYSLQAVAVGARIYAFGGQTNAGVVLDTLEIYNPADDTWTNQAAQMPRARHGFAAVVHGTDVYLVGGEDGDGAPIAEVDVYNTANNQWRQIGDLPTPRAFLGGSLDHNTGAVGGGPDSIVVAGGRLLGGAASAVVEAYIIDEDRWVARSPLPRPRHSLTMVGLANAGALDGDRREGWIIGGQEALAAAGGTRITADLSAYHATYDYSRHLAPMPAGRFMHAAVPVGERVYLLGGREFQETTEGWMWDPETGRFTVIAELPSVQNGLAAVSWGGSVWTFGGTNAFGLALPTVRSYDPVLDAWTERQPMLNGRRDAAAVVLSDTLWVIGGDNNGAVQAVEFYDPATNQWANGPLLPEARSGAVAVVHDGDIIVAGGRDADGTIRDTVYRLRGGAWSVIGTGPAVAHATGTLMHDHRLVIFGGRTPNGISNLHWNYDLATNVLDYVWHGDHQLLARLDYSAIAKVNGELYVFGGNPDPEIAPNGETLVQKLAGRCFDGALGTYEAEPNGLQADVGGGCGAIDPVVAITPSIGYGHHGSCNSWNDCGSAGGCAQMACTYHGHGAVVSFQSSTCDTWRRTGTCDIFHSPRDLDRNFRGCNLPVAINITCIPR